VIKSGNNEPSKSTSWKELEAVLSHLKTFVTRQEVMQIKRTKILDILNEQRKENY